MAPQIAPKGFMTPKTALEYFMAPKSTLPPGTHLEMACPLDEKPGN